jgi:CubicO group peptidase (beta-lactamase class C family)
VRVQYGLPAVAGARVGPDGAIEVATTGLRRTGGVDPVTDDDLWHLGSVTKPMTATLAAVLVEQGAIGWDTTVKGSLGGTFAEIHPDLPAVTLEQLLRHRAGIQPFEEDGEWANVPALSGTPRERRTQFVRWLLAQPPIHAPGTRHAYSNAGYSIAAAMLEAATGRGWEELMAERLFAPLGIDRFAFGWPAAGGRAEPWGHVEKDGALVAHEDLEADGLALLGIGPAGDVAMSMDGLARFARLHLRGLAGHDGLLSADTIRYLHHVDPPDEEEPYAVGWNVHSTRSTHVGSAGTFFAAIYLRFPDGDRAAGEALLVATNAWTPAEEEYGRDLRRAVRAPSP